MDQLFISVILFHALLFSIDELVLHRRRGLPRWERVNHPIDTLLFLIVLVIPVFFAPSAGLVNLYMGLGVLSCLSISKDEFVHMRTCSVAEMWLHCLLFMLHPTSMIVIGYTWTMGEHGYWQQTFGAELVREFVGGLTGGVASTSSGAVSTMSSIHTRGHDLALLIVIYWLSIVGFLFWQLWRWRPWQAELSDPSQEVYK